MTTVFVGNLSAEVTESDLRELFETYGKITSLRHISRRGLAFVELAPEAADAAVDALKGTQLKGRTVDIVLDRSAGGRPGRRRQRGGSRRR